MNRIEVNFTPCTPAPPGGYSVFYRVSGSEDVYTDAGNFFMSPAVFYDTVNPAGTCYDGFIRSDCGDVMGNPVNFSTCESESGDPDRTLTFSVIGGGAGANIRAEFNAPIDVALDIDAVFVDGYNAAGCTGSVNGHMHSTAENIAAGNTSYIGADVKTGPWTGIASFVFYGTVISWPGNPSVIISDGDTVIMGSYSVTIIIEGC